jgi:serine-type D-Ala-D-Ala carboxypeptidase
MEYPAEDTSCLDRIYSSLMSETLQTPPGEAFVYSDLSFETLQFMIGSVVWRSALLTPAEVLQSPYCAGMAAGDLFQPTTTTVQLQCYFEAFVRTRVFGHAAADGPLMPHSSYLLAEERREACMPTMNDTLGNENSYTGQRLQGQVGDGNCYAMGGIAGHAGVFSTAPDLGRFLSRMLRTLAGSGDADDFFLNATTIKTFTTINNVTQSSRALGWDTNTPLVSTYGYDNSCGTMSDSAFMHIGYTGTCVCVDPVNLLWSVVLTNRAYNCNGQSCPPEISANVKAVYRAFNSELIDQAGR